MDDGCACSREACIFYAGQEEEAVADFMSALIILTYRKAQDGRGHHGSYFVEDLIQGTEGDLGGERVRKTE